MQELVYGALRAAGRTFETGQGVKRAFRQVGGLFRINLEKEEQSAYDTENE